MHAHILCVCECSEWGRELGVCSYSSNTNSSIGGQVSDQLPSYSDLPVPVNYFRQLILLLFYRCHTSFRNVWHNGCHIKCKSLILSLNEICYFTVLYYNVKHHILHNGTSGSTYQTLDYPF